MYKIKITVESSDEERLKRQLPNKNNKWKDCEFFINEPISEADYWVVFTPKIPNGKDFCKVSPRNTIFITWEPDSIYHFSQGFLNQFGKVISCQQNLKHKNLIKDQCGLVWRIGMWRNEKREAIITHTYDDFKISCPEKKKLMSIISSNKCFTKGHRDRLKFVDKIKSHFGSNVDLFGRGFNDFKNKWDIIADYKYHIVLENCSIPYYWSEKLADAFLGNAFPFYYGCKNINEFFNSESYREIDILNVEEAINTIENAISQNLAEKNYKEVEKAKHQILDKYNLFDLIVRNINHSDVNLVKENYIIKDDLYFIDFKKIFTYGSRLTNMIKHNL